MRLVRLVTSANIWRTEELQSALATQEAIRVDLRGMEDGQSHPLKSKIKGHHACKKYTQKTVG
jgi:hypothetical protein